MNSALNFCCVLRTLSVIPVQRGAMAELIRTLCICLVVSSVSVLDNELNICLNLNETTEKKSKVFNVLRN